MTQKLAKEWSAGNKMADMESQKKIHPKNHSSLWNNNANLKTPITMEPNRLKYTLHAMIQHVAAVNNSIFCMKNTTYVLNKITSSVKHDQLVKKFPTFYEIRRFITVFTPPPPKLVFILSQMNPVCTNSHYYF
jgi:hypothetical protein